METEEVIVDAQDEVVHEEEVHTEMEGEEIEQEHEPDRSNSPEEILPDVKTKTTAVPPLRPLNIAPKPAKVPISVKPVTGQQLLLLQGPGNSQAIKLLSPQGQELNLTNFSLSRPITLKPTIKTLNTQGGNISLVQQKPVVMKKILATGQKTVQKPITFSNKQNQHFMVVQKADQQQVKLVQSSGVTTMPSPTKTITLQQAQEMGLLTNAKFVPSAQSTPKLVTKSQQKTIKLVPQVTPLVTTTKGISVNQIKSPTKILPATSQTGGSGKVPQRMIFKTTQTILPTGQIIQVAGTQALNSGQVHQINIPGKGMQFIKFVTTTNADTNSSSSSVNTVKSSGTNIVLSEIKPIVATSNIAPKPIKPMQKQVTVSGTQMVVIPSSFSTISTTQQAPKLTVTSRQVSGGTPKTVQTPQENTSSNVSSSEASAESNGIRPRKPCNCTKSQCLKLYCDCFANGEFCYMCNCMNCYNNLDNEEHRNRAIKACLDRNPNAFRPKIGKAKDTSGDLSVRKHTKGCNCKRSGCLKNYCECYEAKIACSNNCKCIGCRNIEDSLEKKNLRIAIDNGLNNIQPVGKIFQAKDVMPFLPKRTTNTKQAINFITDEVIEATCQCLLTLSNSAEDNMQDEEVTQRQIIEEFGRCLTEIISCSANRV